MQYNPEELNDILNIFKAESEEIIQELNDGFMQLEKNPDEKNPLKKLMQLSHSLKGAARMLGFTSIQDLAHKLEDILSFWKNDDVEINMDSFEIIYKVCDFLNILVNKSVEIKENYNTSEVLDFLGKLDNFLTTNKMVPVENPNILPKDYIFEKSMDIKAIVLELMFVIEKDDINEDLEEVFLVINDNLKQLSDIFKDTEFEDIKNKIFALTKYMSESNEKEIDTVRQAILELRNEIYHLYKDRNIITSSTDSVQKQQKESNLEQPAELPSADKEILSVIESVIPNISTIKYEKSSINNLVQKLNEIVAKTENENIKTISSKIINILNLFYDKDMLISNECYIVILQGIYLIKNLIIKEKEINTNNINSLVQRLTVVEDMFNIPSNNEIEPTSKNSINNQTGYDDLKKTFSNFDLQEIKTLRVDTVKLDNLISQTGELLINGIKTREHIVELSKINAKLIKWNSVSKKIINYLKYLEKKGIFNSDTDDSSGMFFRRTQDFFINNAEIINEINNDFTNLYNIISEDDNKLHQTTMEIESIAKGIRVLPLATLFHSFPRMVRDIAQENNKKIDFIISGSDTTVDKKIIEEIKMPLIHIIRNAVSHGIEIPEDRIKNNKSETGTIRLVAKQIENNVVITVEDDGYGVNLEKIKNLALKKGLLSEEEITNITTDQLMKLLFLPGFSTEDSVTEISGRGIGLDVVKTKINNLNGDIIMDSVLNKGCKVTIRLPLSMSTIKTFIILAGGQKYSLPVSAVKYIKQINKNEIIKRNGKDTIIYDEHSIPIYSLSAILEETESKFEDTASLTVIIIENQDKQAGFVVDKLVGDAEVFHKKLVPPILRIKNISGFSTLSTGEICLIINPFELIRNAV